MIVARLDEQGAVLDFMDWRDATPLPANCRPATAGELAILNPVPTAQQTALAQLVANDALMFRGLEVLIDALLAKGVIIATDFPAVVRAMYLARKSIRTTAGVP